MPIWNSRRIFGQIYCESSAAKGPYPGGKKLLLYPTNPTPMMLYKALRYMTGVGFVEYVRCCDLCSHLGYYDHVTLPSVKCGLYVEQGIPYA